jgi:hypothetical protein
MYSREGLVSQGDSPAMSSKNCPLTVNLNPGSFRQPPLAPLNRLTGTNRVGQDLSWRDRVATTIAMVKDLLTARRSEITQ